MIDVVQKVILVPLELKSKRRNDREHKLVSNVSLQWSKINTITFSGDVVFVNCYLTSELQEITGRREGERKRRKERYFIVLLGIKNSIGRIDCGFTFRLQSLGIS